MGGMVSVNPGSGGVPAVLQGWKLVRASTYAGFALTTVDAVRTVLTYEAAFRVAVSVVSLGVLLLGALIVYGINIRTRWGLWTGGVVSGIAIVILPLLLIAALQSSGVAIKPVDVIIPIAECIAGGGFLAGLVLLRHGTKREG